MPGGADPSIVDEGQSALDLLTTLVARDSDVLKGAVATGADYIGVGPIFATMTKDDVCADSMAKLVRYSGWYSNRMRGDSLKAGKTVEEGVE